MPEKEIMKVRDQSKMACRGGEGGGAVVCHKVEPC